MEIKEFKKRLARRKILRVCFLADFDAIENVYGHHNRFDSKKSKMKDQVLFDIYREKNNVKAKLRVLKGITEYMDYKCDFDKNGKCRGIRKKKGAYWRTAKCCCQCCARSIGYLKFVPDNSIKYYADKFDEKFGFWNPDSGCQIADRSLRSETCLRYSCHPDEKFKATMFLYGGEIRNLEEQIKELQREENRHKKT